jgi:3-deoxy-manno-octulosonate cytidylyltransferase (CMP-KDO synthetase)
MSAVIVIPSRLAAARLPNKPLAMIQGKPMVQHVWERAIEANSGPVLVACCGTELENVIRNFGGQPVVTDPNLPSGTDRVWAAAKQRKDKLIVNLQGDLPFIDPQLIQKAIQLMENPDIDIGTVACPISDQSEIHNENVVKIALSLYEKDKGRALYFSRSPIPFQASVYYHHIGLYVFRRSVLEKFVSLPPSTLEKSERLEQLRAMEAGFRIDVALVDSIPVTVDTQSDLNKLINI